MKTIATICDYMTMTLVVVTHTVGCYYLFGCTATVVIVCIQILLAAFLIHELNNAAEYE